MLSDIFSFSFTLLLPNWLLISIRIYSGIARFPCDSMAFLYHFTYRLKFFENNFTVIVSLGVIVLCGLHHRGYFRGNTPEILTEIGVGYGKSGFQRTIKALISLKRGKMGPRLLGPIGSRIRAFDWCQNQRLSITLEVIMHALFHKHCAP